MGILVSGRILHPPIPYCPLEGYWLGLTVRLAAHGDPMGVADSLFCMPCSLPVSPVSIFLVCLTHPPGLVLSVLSVSNCLCPAGLLPLLLFSPPPPNSLKGCSLPGFEVGFPLPFSTFLSASVSPVSPSAFTPLSLLPHPASES